MRTQEPSDLGHTSGLEYTSGLLTAVECPQRRRIPSGRHAAMVLWKSRAAHYSTVQEVGQRTMVLWYCGRGQEAHLPCQLTLWT